MSSADFSQQDIFAKNNYDIRSLDDEVRADVLCGRLLKQCYLYLVETHELSAAEASRLCYGASYFLCEYLIPDRRVNLFDITAQLIRQFAGNWYIIKNMEPNLAELTGILEGVMAFYDYSCSLGLVSGQQLQEVQSSCADLAYYQGRIDSFYAIENDGYFQWNADCPLKS
ncbi:hypothetical protein [Trichloromonas sp.]|uniref:hypothetical protein n=1 Tax=Trichloromonas sp. TaxID=3069249 RepID=UPI003D814914